MSTESDHGNLHEDEQPTMSVNQATNTEATSGVTRPLDTNEFDSDKQIAEAKECADVIKYLVDGKQYHDKQAARADPNKRLVGVFGIDNAFTNYDIKFKEEFASSMRKLMKEACGIVDRNSKGDWTGLHRSVTAHCADYMGRQRDTFNLSELVQYITLKTSLCYLFDDASEILAEKDCFDDILYIGRRINELWIESKKSGEGGSKWTDEKMLHEALRRVTTKAPRNLVSTDAQFPIVLVRGRNLLAFLPWVNTAWAKASCYLPAVLNKFRRTPTAIPATPADTNEDEGPEPTIPRRNPMNLLLPAYETMWRVVLRCFLEIRYREAENGLEWSTVLTEYLEVLGNAEDQRGAFQKSSETGVKPIDIVKEALRLYPPTRHVHRTFNNELVQADIEGCHRAELLGGADPLIFRPERWQDICPEQRAQKDERQAGKASASNDLKTAEEKLGYMPFAVWCTADGKETAGFGYKMIALLVGVLCKDIGEEWKLKDGDCLPSREREPLESDREAYERIILEVAKANDVVDE